MEWVTDEETKHTIKYFVRGHEYKLFGLIETNWHFMGLNVDTSTAPQPFYPLGTDRMGRDMFSRLMYGTRVSMSIGLVGVGPEHIPRLAARRAFRAARRHDGCDNPAHHRIRARDTDDTSVAGAVGGSAARLVHYPRLFRHHDNHLADRVDAACA